MFFSQIYELFELLGTEIIMQVTPLKQKNCPKIGVTMVTLETSVPGGLRSS